MKAALVNKETQIVENVILVNSLDEPVDPSYDLIEVDMLKKDLSAEDMELYEIIKELDPGYYIEKVLQERIVHIGQTKWNATVGFYEGD